MAGQKTEILVLIKLGFPTLGKTSCKLGSETNKMGGGNVLVGCMDGPEGAR